MARNHLIEVDAGTYSRLESAASELGVSPSDYVAHLCDTRTRRARSTSGAGLTAKGRAKLHSSRHERISNALVESVRTLQRATDEGGACRDACQIAVDTGGFRMAWLGPADAEGTSLVPVSSASLEDHEVEVSWARSGSERGFEGDAIRHGRVQVAHATDTGVARQAPGPGYGSSITIPLREPRRPGHVLGTLNLYAREDAPFDDLEVALLTSLADEISGTICRLRLEPKLAAFGSAMEQAGESIAITDIRGTIVYVNPAFVRSTGYSSEEAIGQSPRILQSGEHGRDFYRQMWSTITAGETWVGRIENSRKNGSRFVVDATIAPVLSESGEILRFVGVERDITRELEAEAGLLRSHRTELVGRLAGGIAHDFNNLLTVIDASSELMANSLPDDEALRDDLEDLREATRQAAQLTRQLLAFSRREVVRPEVLDINEVVERLARMLRRVIPEHIDVCTDLAPDVGSVRLDPGHLEQVLLNLALNARDAMPLGGELRIETRNANVDGSSEDSVEVVVRDTGHGMDEATKARIFEPFFTTKNVDRGTGIGLATVAEIVRKCHGALEVESAPGRGSAFSILLPRVSPRQLAAEPDTTAEPPCGRQTILLVENDETLRRLTARVLRRGGYTVLEAGTIGHAETIVERGGRVDLLVSDVFIPGKEHRRVGRPRSTQLPTQVARRTLYMSGCTAATLARSGALAQGKAFLHKPFSPDSLIRAVRQVLDEELRTRT